MSGAGSVLDEEDLRARVQKVLDAYVEARCADLETIDERLRPVADVLQTLLAGGKRIRPAFAYWGWRGAGGEDGEAVVRAVASLELVQACALLHDDVMDDSDTRRGAPAAHRAFAADHQRLGWTGDARRFGEGAAILLGDLCLSWADALLCSSGLSSEQLARGKPQYDDMRTEVMAGQFLDLVEQAQATGDVATALSVARWKSAAYTVARPLRLGGSLAGGPDDLLVAYDAYGIPLGTAFQLRDDLLGVLGDPAVTGKPAGDDLREGKRTVLVAEACARTDDAGRAALAAVLGVRDADDAAVARAVDVLRTCGAIAAVEARIDALTEQALAALDSRPAAPPAQDVLARLALAATARST